VLTGDCCCTRLLLCTKQNFFWFFIYTGRVCTIKASYTLQFSPKGGCNRENYCNTHRTRQIIKKKKTRLKYIYACVECVLRNEPVRHRNRQSAPIDPKHDYIETFFTTDVSGHAPAPRQPSDERD
jgi:hypothetical protein